MGTTSCHSARHEYKLKDQNTFVRENSINAINMQSNKENLLGKTQQNTQSKNLKTRKPFSDITNKSIHTKIESIDNVKIMKAEKILIKNSEEPDLEFKDFDSIQKATRFLSDATFLFQFFTTNLKMIETFKYAESKNEKNCNIQTMKGNNEMRENLKYVKKQKSKSFAKKSNLYLNEESLKEKELDDLFMRLPFSPNKSSASTPQFHSNAIKLSKQKNKILEDYLPKEVLFKETVDNSTRLEAYLFDSSSNYSKKNQEQMVCYDEPNLFHIPNERKKSLLLSRNATNNDIYNRIMEQPKIEEKNLVISSLNSEDLKPRIFSVKQEAYEQFEVEEIKKEDDEEEGYELEGFDESGEMYYENEESSEIQKNDENNDVTESDKNLEIKRIHSQIYEKPFDYYDQERKTNCKKEYNEFIEMVNTRRELKEDEDKFDFSNIDSINLSQLTIQKRHPVFSEEEGEDEAHMININLYELIQNRIKTKKSSESNRRYMFEQEN